MTVVGHVPIQDLVVVVKVDVFEEKIQQAGVCV
jgi:hypothetical protein